MGLRRRHCSPRRGLRSVGIRSTPLRMVGQFTSPKTPPNTYLSSTVPKSNSPWRTQPSLTYKLRLSPNWRSPFLLSSPPRPVAAHGLGQVVVPQTLKQMDEFLSSAWKDDAPVSSEHSRKLSELHSIYTSKMAQIDRKELEMLAQCQCLPSSSQSSDINRSPDKMAAILRSSYSDIKKKLKEEIVSSILKLQTKLKYQQNRDGTASQQRKIKSSKKVKKSPKKATAKKKLGILNKWFDDHSDKLCLNKKEKENLARRCNVTISQLSTWFNNKRRRSNCTKNKTEKGKGKGKATKKHSS